MHYYTAVYAAPVFGALLALLDCRLQLLALSHGTARTVASDRAASNDIVRDKITT